MTKIKKTIIIIAAIVLALVLIGLWVLFNNGLLGVHFHKEAKEGQIKVACVGDSITYGHGISEWLHYNYPAQLQDMLGDKYHVENFGHSGRTLSDNGDKPYTKSEQFKLSLEYDADIVVIMLGTNDTKPQNWTDINTFADEYDEFIKLYRENNPDVRIIICTPANAFFPKGQKDGKTNFDIQPKHITEISYRLRLLALARGCELVDIYDLTRNHKEWFEADNVHPDADGANAIAEAVGNKIINK